MANKRQIHALEVYFNSYQNIVISQSSQESPETHVIISKDQAGQLSEWILEMANEPDMEGED